MKYNYLVLFLILQSCSLQNINDYLSDDKNKKIQKDITTAKHTIDISTNEKNKITLEQHCLKELKTLPGKFKRKNGLKELCSNVIQKKGCESHLGIPIFHYEKKSNNPYRTKILVFGTIHGDEESSSHVVRTWMERLLEITPRNTWRLIPILNPDGRKLKTRMNYNKVDLNRNFPTINWKEESKIYWEEKTKKNPRRYPGTMPASEIETKCAVEHIKEFSPDLIISIHTPLGVLDFDGPRLKYPYYNLLPWKRLGHFPGSLGRYMWRDHKIPVLTVELKGNKIIKSIKSIDSLQDVAGLLSIMTTVNK